MSFPLEAMQHRIGFGSTHPRMAAFLERIRARPAYKRALERGGPYAIAG
jgi:glutathione S-transferase